MKTTNLRIPDELHKALKESAKRNHRSMNSEILQAIELYLEPNDTATRKQPPEDAKHGS